MKPKLYFLAIVAICAVVTQSCSTKMYTSRSQPISRGAIPTTPMIADLKVDLTKKVTATGFVKGKRVTVDDAKDVALYNAMTSTGADVIIDPICKCTIRQLMKTKITCEVVGYPAVYTGLHVATDEEIMRLKDFAATQGKQQPAQQVAVQKKKGFFGR